MAEESAAVASDTLFKKKSFKANARRRERENSDVDSDGSDVTRTLKQAVISLCRR